MATGPPSSTMEVDYGAENSAQGHFRGYIVIRVRHLQADFRCPSWASKSKGGAGKSTRASNVKLHRMKWFPGRTVVYAVVQDRAFEAIILDTYMCSKAAGTAFPRSIKRIHPILYLHPTIASRIPPPHPDYAHPRHIVEDVPTALEALFLYY
ncbi:hypothetical protein FIBSPDRAFT_939184 [Athelia psychrophila]|uniref:Uncharacterized protein n=1 Tax=Athelia psychrophila TaxID=1759441 RepID=A0A165WZB5_9AGAM|nr:hypothetical protein FIBSPDRAFT_939184 [Fibularhizoctonia sp. CBS 109695]